MAILTHALSSVGAYVDFFVQQPLPVLRRTVEAFAHLAQDLDKVTRLDIASTVQADPLMTMRLLSHMETHRENTQNHDITTVNSAIVMMGILPFFKAFGDMPTAEDVLASQPKALVGLLRAVGRATKAAHFARDWAVIRHDLDVNEITIAALLHEAPEMMCWISAPDLIQRVFDIQRADRELSSSAAQHEVFGITAQELQFALIHAWHLPQLLVHLLDKSQANHPRVRNITLAVELARHMTHGWDNEAMLNDISNIHALLRIPPETLLRHIGAPEEAWPILLPACRSL
jgi:HD-like signal output (HDOD) protein